MEAWNYVLFTVARCLRAEARGDRRSNMPVNSSLRDARGTWGGVVLWKVGRVACACVIGGEMGREATASARSGNLLDAMEDRLEIDVGESELIADEKAGFGDGSVENHDLFAHRGQNCFDRRSVRLCSGFLLGAIIQLDRS